MRGTYGSYQHDHSELAIRSEQHAIFDTFRRRIGEKIRFTCLGVKRAANQAELNTKLEALVAAYRNDYQDFVLYQDDGTTPTILQLRSDQTFGGVKVVVPPSMVSGPWSGQPEFANMKTYFFVLEAETRVGDGLYAYKQRMLIKGTGGPKWVYSPQQVGDPQIQILQTNTTFWYIQHGVAVGRKGYPDLPPPVYPGIEHANMREVGVDTPEQMVYGGESELFRLDWKYFMEATVSQGFSAFELPSI